MLRFRIALAVVLLVALAACGGGTASGDGSATTGSDIAAPSLATQSASASSTTGDGGGDTGGGDTGGGDTGASIDVTVAGGEFEGSYSGTVEDGGCSRGATGENTFGLQYSTDEAVELSSLQLVVNDADAAASGGTDDFMTSLTFGDLLEGTTVDVSPPDSNGSGTVSVDDRGDTATITIDAETAEGAAIDATVECHSVFDFGG